MHLHSAHFRLRRAGLLLSFLLTLLLISCSEIMYLNVEQMLPPEIMPEHAARSVGVVSNFSQNNVVVADHYTIVLPCDADTIKEEVALTFANSDIMDRVVVLDSLLYHPDSTSTHILSQEEIIDLCELLDVEMIYSIDFACLVYNPSSRFISRPLNAYLCSRIYTPRKDSTTIASIIDKEVLEYWVENTDEIGELFPLVPSQLAKSAIEPYMPTWKERERVFYYDRFNYDLREAKVYVNEGYWEEASKHWRELLQSKRRMQRFEAAFNMALYYEMTDSIDKALSSLEIAKEAAVKTDRKGNTVQLIDTMYITQYRGVLQKRQKEIAKIDEYMKSFED